METHLVRRDNKGLLHHHGRCFVAAVVLATALVATPVSAAPEFVTQPAEIYEQFTALKEPRADLPVGALWVQDYGPHGEGAAADNLVTVRSLSGIALSGDMQLRLTLGLAALLNLEPGYSRRITARFTDVSIVRVKELSKLSGPAGEPRVYEALKAGTINVTTDRDIGLDLGGALEVKNLPVVARADTGGKKSFTIDGRDLFIAFSIAASVPSRGPAREVDVAPGKEAEVTIGDYRVRVQLPEQSKTGSAAEPCAPATVSLSRSATKGDGVTVSHDFSAAGSGALTLPLPVPVADGEGGLLTAIAVRLVGPRPGGAASGKVEGCFRTGLRLALRLEGERLKRLSNAKAPGW